MTTFAVDPADMGEAWIEDLIPTKRIDVGEGGRRLNPPAPRRPWAGTGHHDTGEQPVWPTGAEVVVGFGQPRPASPLATYPPIGPQPTPPQPMPSPTPAPPPPAWNGPVVELPVMPGPRHALAGQAGPVVRPTRVQARAYRRDLSRRDRRARAASVVLLLVLAGAVVALWVVTR